MKKTCITWIAAIVCCLALASCGDDEPTRMTYESVDLGLSVRWATMNVGALKPEDHGQLFGWADSTGSHKKFDDITISYRQDGNIETTLVDWGSSYFGGKTPRADISGTAYDIATYQWNAKWRMPTRDEWNELMTRCSWSLETSGGVAVYRVTGPNGNHILLPMTGIRATSETESGRNTMGYYWTSTLLPQSQQAAAHYESTVPCAAWCVRFTETEQPAFNTAVRCYGLAIRPVAR